jgi:acetyl esterase/lipase
MSENRPASLPSLAVPAREIPLPTTVSPELQKVIAGPIPPRTQPPTTPDGWKKLQREQDAEVERLTADAVKEAGVTIEPAEIAGVKCHYVAPKHVLADRDDNLIVVVHGGAFVFNSAAASFGEAALLANACKTRVVSIDYRVPPDHPFPAASDDILAVWSALAKVRDPKTMAMGGTSAGAALTMTTILRCKAEKLPMPAALFLGTPAADMTKTGDSQFLNAEVDHTLGRFEGMIEECHKLYAGGQDLLDPLLSPVYGDFTGWPPTVLISGTRDLLLSTTIRIHRRLRAARVTAELHVYEGMSHADYLTAYRSPESRDALGEVSAFFARHLTTRAIR